MTYEQAFAKVKKKLEKANTSSFTSDFAIQVNLTDDDCSGIFYVAFIGGNFAVEPYDYVDNNAVIYATADDFINFVSGKIDVDSDKISVDGSVDAAKSLCGIAKTVRKTAAKKATAAKETPVKETAAKETVVKETPAKETTVKETAAKAAPAKKTAAAEKAAEKATAAKKPAAEKTTQTKAAAAAKTTTAAAKTAATKTTAAKKTAKTK